MPDINWNKSVWDGSYDWTGRGSEWSTPWGSVGGQWLSTVVPRIATFLPCENLLEIAPGYGRWTRYLVPLCGHLVGVDLSERCVISCREEFPESEFHVNDGQSLSMLEGRSFDLIFSFDSLVHADLDAIVQYIPQIVNLLSPRGIAFIHHSNLGEFSGLQWGHRSEEVSASQVATLVKESKGRVLVQEKVAGGEIPGTDAFTLFCGENAYSKIEPQTFDDEGLWGSEAILARERFSHYSAITDMGRTT